MPYPNRNITSSKGFKQRRNKLLGLFINRSGEKNCTKCAQETFQEKTNILSRKDKYTSWRSSNEDIKVQSQHYNYFLCFKMWREKAKVPINKSQTRERRVKHQRNIEIKMTIILLLVRSNRREGRGTIQCCRVASTDFLPSGQLPSFGSLPPLSSSHPFVLVFQLHRWIPIILIFSR